MDYPGVTEVIQVGLTEREQYIHRRVPNELLS